MEFGRTLDGSAHPQSEGMKMTLTSPPGLDPPQPSLQITEQRTRFFFGAPPLNSRTEGSFFLEQLLDLRGAAQLFAYSSFCK